MAARQQPKGTGLGVQYEDLIPKSEWKDQPESTLLTIDLPGFAKEQIKVTYVHTSRMIRVTGERPLGDRRWSRFNEVFTVPQNCLVDKIHGSFKNNALTITMPKETITKMGNLPESSKTVAEKVKQLEEKRLLEEEAEKKRKLVEEKEEILRKLQEEAKAKEMAMERKLQEEAKAKEMALARKLQEEVIAKEMAKARKLQEEVRAKEEARARKLQEEVKAKEKLEERKRVEEASIKKKPVDESVGNRKMIERVLPEVDYTKFVTKPLSGGASEVVKSREEKLGYLVEKEKKTEKGILEKMRGKEITSEEKKLMVNTGVAALVIFALGAYVSYTFCSSSSPPSKPE